MRADAERMQAALRAHEALVQALRIRIVRLQRPRFGASSEKIEREIDQLELALETPEVAISSARDPIPEDVGETGAEPPAADVQPRRRRPKVAASTPRERIVLDPGDACPDCGGALRLIDEGEEDQETVQWTVSPTNGEILELIAAKLKVIETARPKKSCRRCEKTHGAAWEDLCAHAQKARNDRGLQTAHCPNA